MSIYTFKIHSTSDIDTEYTFVIETDPPRVYCDCIGFCVHGRCKHIKMYKALITKILIQNPGL